jgi:hypothetical protein
MLARLQNQLKNNADIGAGLEGDGGMMAALNKTFRSKIKQTLGFAIA